MPRELRDVLLIALRAQGGHGRFARSMGPLIFRLLLAQALAAAGHDGPPHAASRAPRQVRAKRHRLPHRDSLAGRRPRG